MSKGFKGGNQASDFLAMTLAARRKRAGAEPKKTLPPVAQDPTAELEAEIDRIKTLSLDALQAYERYLMEISALDDAGTLYRADLNRKD